MSAQLTVRPATLDEQVVLDAYKEAIKGALASADSAAEKTLTAAFSLATAYGALVALVKPEKTPAPVLVGLPFLFFALGAIASAWALSTGISALKTNDVDVIRRTIEEVIAAKRFRTGVAVVCMGVAVVTAGLAILTAYG